MIPIAASAPELDVSANPLPDEPGRHIRRRIHHAPIATPASLMVQAPGGYTFGDHWKLGLRMLALFFIIAVFLGPVIWSS
jgi:hypothetical protein